MTNLLDQAIARLKALPDDQHDAAAAATLEVIEAFESGDLEALTAEEWESIRDILAQPRRIATPEVVAAAFAPRAK